VAGGGVPMQLITPRSTEHLDQVRGLMRAFLAWHRERHTQDAHLIDAYFDAAAFEDELASLPGEYGPPGGALLLALEDGGPAGCVAFRRLDATACEMKRMFVPPLLHGRGIGRALGREIIAQARGAGYAVMRLDTSIRQLEAQRLYAALGFRRIEPYYPLEPAVRDWLVFMERSL